jgi:MYXO-CTERM domain-containing protein
MGIRSLVLFSFTAAVLSLAPSARADVPTGSTTSSTTAAGTGGAAGDPGCTVDVQQVAGTTCQTCDPTTSACGSLGSDYSYVCTASTKSAVYCTGANRLVAPDNNLASGCAVSMPGSALGGGAAGVLAIAAALMMRRRRRG